MHIFIIIPVHNESGHVGKVLSSLNKYKLPVIIVDDGSTDDTKAKIQKAKFDGVVALSHSINLGKGAAMKTGAEYAFTKGADAVIFMDSDGQHKATDLPQFVGALESGNYDVVFGSRNLGMGVPLVRYLGNKVASVISAALFGTYVSDAICGFRGITRNGYKKVKWESNGYGVEVEMVARVGKYKISSTEVPVETVYLDEVKGVTLLDAFGILGQVIKWKLTL